MGGRSVELAHRRRMPAVLRRSMTYDRGSDPLMVCEQTTVRCPAGVRARREGARDGLPPGTRTAAEDRHLTRTIRMLPSRQYNHHDRGTDRRARQPDRLPATVWAGPQPARHCGAHRGAVLREAARGSGIRRELAA
jgi:hypothetical protein